ncbi:UbiA prenyltransferase family protein [Myxococcota bacterium]
MSLHQVCELIGAGVQFGRALLRGRARLGESPFAYARVLANALRPHFFALPAGAALAGAASCPDVQNRPAALAAGIAGLGWGVGQLLNDLLDREADAVDAPDRPAVKGRLPEGPTMLFAMLLGVLLAVLTATLHPAALWLAVGAATLLVGYGPAKRVPLLGNLAHGALMGLAAMIGAAAVSPRLALREVLEYAGGTVLVVGGWAMVYLESNYEKDRKGDSQAGYCTLANCIGLRASAVLRAVGALVLGLEAHSLGLLTAPAGRGAMVGAVLLVFWSSSVVLRFGTEHAALVAYRPSVHGAGLGMLALAYPVCGPVWSIGLAALNAWLIERAFARSANP